MPRSSYNWVISCSSSPSRVTRSGPGPGPSRAWRPGRMMIIPPHPGPGLSVLSHVRVTVGRPRRARRCGGAPRTLADSNSCSPGRAILSAATLVKTGAPCFWQAAFQVLFIYTLSREGDTADSDFAHATRAPPQRGPAARAAAPRGAGAAPRASRGVRAWGANKIAAS